MAVDKKQYLAEGKSKWTLSLTKLTGGVKIKDVVGYLTTEFGEVTFVMSQIIFEDGTSAFCEGEHDMPYLTDIPHVAESLLEELEADDD